MAEGSFREGTEATLALCCHCGHAVCAPVNGPQAGICHSTPKIASPPGKAQASIPSNAGVEAWSELGTLVSLQPMEYFQERLQDRL